MTDSDTQLQDTVRRIIKIAETVDVEYRQKTFEVLLQQAVAQDSDHIVPRPPAEKPHSEAARPSQPLSKELRLFLSRNGLSEENVLTLVELSDGKAELLQFPRAQNRAQGQISLALLTALLAGVEGRALEVDAGRTRDLCKTSNYYDNANFATHFKKNVSLFGGPVRIGGPPRRLSLEGEKRLAQLVQELTRDFV